MSPARGLQSAASQTEDIIQVEVDICIRTLLIEVLQDECRIPFTWLLAMLGQNSSECSK